ncbi:MAG: hypothetical protein ACLGH0_10395 [Thermoanaerobaculia bacterium]
MPYKVQFAGLVCFYRQSGARLALLPDGRNPGAGIDPHYASIVIHEDWVDGESGWEGVQRDDGGVFPLDEPCEVVFENADVAGDLDLAAHEGKLPQLRQIDPTFEINLDTAITIARVPIRQGKLTAHLIPQGSAVVSQLVVPHDGDITITVNPDNGSAERTIRAQAGAEIAITNMARGVYDAAGEPERTPHFKIYEKLSAHAVSLNELPVVNQQLSELQSRNPLFTARGPIGVHIECSNSGCC